MTTDTASVAAASRPVRVLHIIEATLGGTLRYLENIAAAEHEGMELGLAYGNSRADSRLRPLLDKVQARGWKTYNVDMRREVEPLRDLKALLRLRKVIQDFSPDIVHCHSSKAGALGRIAAVLQFRRRPVRLYTPNALAVPLGRHYLTIEKLIGRFTDRFVAVSDSERKEMLTYGLDKHSAIDVVYPLIDSEFFAPSSRADARSLLGLSDAPLVLGIGRLMPQKDPGSFVQILERVHAHRPDIRAVWLGSGDGEGDFRRELKKARLEDVVQIVPWQHDVRPYIAAANVLLSTSQFESFGYMVAEALSMAIPAVATDITGTCDIMRDELSDWLYPVRDYERATGLLLTLLSNLKAADALGRRARMQILRRFSTDQMRQNLTDTYHRSLKRVA